MSVKERLKKFIEYKGLSERAFAMSVGLSATYIASMRKSIQPDKVNSIAIHYPDLNTGWLMTGEGEMLKSPKNNFSQLPNEQMSETISEVFTEKLMTMYKDGEIYPAEVVNRIVDEYNSQIKELHSTIMELQRRIWEFENSSH